LSAFLAKWTNIEPEEHSAEVPMLQQPQAASSAESPGTCGRVQEHGASQAAGDDHGLPWAGWKAASLNRLFQEQGVIGQTGRITSATVSHGMRDKKMNY